MEDQVVTKVNLTAVIAKEVKSITREFKASRVCHNIEQYNGNQPDSKWV